MVRLGGRGERDAGELRAEFAEPERKPASLETGVAGDEDAAPVINSAEQPLPHFPGRIIAP